MDNTKIEVGSTVRLNSGGPLMTVTKLSETDPECECMWFPFENEDAPKWNWFQLKTVHLSS